MRYNFYHSISFFVCFYLNVPFSDLDIVIVIRRITLTCASINTFVNFWVAPTKYGYLFLKQMFSDAKKSKSYCQLYATYSTLKVSKDFHAIFDQISYRYSLLATPFYSHLFCWSWILYQNMKKKNSYFWIFGRIYMSISDLWLVINKIT